MSLPSAHDPIDAYAKTSEGSVDHAPETLIVEPQVGLLRQHRHWWLPLLLFLLTCWTTFGAGGLWFALPLMTILLCHEFGHYFTARWYRVPASLPYFIPMPISPFGTMGAVIGMRPGHGDLKSIFDIGIAGPLAGLVPTMLFSYVGLKRSTLFALDSVDPSQLVTIGEPLVFQWLIRWVFGPLPDGYDVFIHPMAFAGWAGIFVTCLNLIPIGQLDGGHILYALFRERAHYVSQAIFFGSVVIVVAMGYWHWVLLLCLLLMVGLRHPPTANDSVDIGRGRQLLGIVTLLFIIIGFTPQPLS
jgi:membrane-associated protease RseP (regulator of RpoE activity)